MTPHPNDVLVCRVDGTPLQAQLETPRARTVPATPRAPRPQGSAVRGASSEGLREPTEGMSRARDDDRDQGRVADAADEDFDLLDSSDSGSGHRAAGSSPSAETHAMRGGASGAKRAPAPVGGRPGDRAEDVIGNVLGSYRLLEVIGRGGMGRVYAAEHIRLGRRVALKVLRPEYAVKRDAVARFFQEAKAVNKIRHRNIVDVTDFVELPDGTTFIIMELLEGVSLGKVQRTEGHLEEPRLLSILVQVCDALEAVHAVGIVHRDLKPDNIFLVPDGAGAENVKLLDFGVAKLLASEDGPDEGGEVAWRTAAGSVVGTPAYMSPEQAGGQDIDGRSDVYSLGAIMYELFCGEPLFKARSFGEFVLKHVNETPVPPRRTAGGAMLSEDLEAIILRCLSKKAAGRYPTVTQLRTELVRQLGVLDTGMMSLRQVSRSVVPNARHTPNPTPGSAMSSAPHSGSRPGASSASGSASTGRRSASGARAPIPADEAVTPAPSLSNPSAAALAGSPLGASILGDESSFDAPARPGLETNLSLGELQPPAAASGARSSRPFWAAATLVGIGALGTTAYLLATGSTGDAPAIVRSTPAAGPEPTVAPIVEPATPGQPLVEPAPAADGPRRIVLKLRSDPAGAEVYAFGSDTAVCTTPCPDLTIDPNDGGAVDRRVFVFRRAGFQETRFEVPLDEGDEQDVFVVMLETGDERRPPRVIHRSDPRPPTKPAVIEPPKEQDPPPTNPDKKPDRVDESDTLDPFGKKK